MRPHCSAGRRFSAPNSLDLDNFKQASKSFLESGCDRDPFFKAHWVGHYSKPDEPTESTATPVVPSDLVTQIETSCFTAWEGANLEAQ